MTTIRTSVRAGTRLACLALLVIAACKTDSPQNPCGGTVELLHAPTDTTISLGKSWTYDYQRTHISTSLPPNTRILGTLRWTITTVEDCMDGERRCDVREEFSGHNEVTVTSNNDYRDLTRLAESGYDEEMFTLK